MGDRDDAAAARSLSHRELVAPPKRGRQLKSECT